MAGLIVEEFELPGAARGRMRFSGQSFRLDRGTVALIVGPSGAGKSSLLRGIAGLERRARGRVRYDNIELSALAPSQRGTALVSQDPALLPHLTVLDNIALPLKFRGVSSAARRKRASENALRMGLSDALLGRSPEMLSGGERRRASIARALLQEPQILLLDEPLAGLDPALARDLQRDLENEIRMRGTTSLWVTHDRRCLDSIADRVLCLVEGCLVQDGSPHEIRTNPSHAEVARFLGDDEWLVLPMESGPDPRRVQHGSLEVSLPGGGSVAAMQLAIPASDAWVEPTSRAPGSRSSLTLSELRFERDAGSLRLSGRTDGGSWVDVRMRDRQDEVERTLAIEDIEGGTARLHVDLSRARLFVDGERAAGDLTT